MSTSLRDARCISDISLPGKTVSRIYLEISSPKKHSHVERTIIKNG